jgi:hypothetical protein
MLITKGVDSALHVLRTGVLRKGEYLTVQILPGGYHGSLSSKQITITLRSQNGGQTQRGGIEQII